MFSVILFLAIIALVVGFVMPSKDDDDLSAIAKWLKSISLVLIILSVFGSAYFSVPAGYRGVLLNFGAVKGVMGEGVQFVIPFVQKVELMEVRTQKEEAKAAAASKDLQNVSTTVAINYHLNPLQVGNLYKNVGLDFASRIIDPATQETVKAVVANYTAEELIRLRSKIKNEIDTQISSFLKISTEQLNKSRWHNNRLKNRSMNFKRLKLMPKQLLPEQRVKLDQTKSRLKLSTKMVDLKFLPENGLRSGMDICHKSLRMVT